MLHGAYSFPLSFKASLVSTILERLALDDGATVLDPFCGAGTSLLECQASGISSIGIDANPVCVIVSKAKTDWAIRPSTAKALSEKVLLSASRKYRVFLSRRQRKKSVGEKYQPQYDLIFNRSQTGKYLISSGLIERGWISPLAALKTLLIVESLEKIPARSRNFLYLALLGLLVPEISNMSYGPEIYRKRRRIDPDVFGLFRTRVLENLEGLEALRSLKTKAKTVVQLGDSVNGGLTSIDSGTVKAVISSPPYLSDHDYTRMTRLELVFSGHVSSRDDLRKLKKGFLRSSSKNVYKEDQLARHVRRFPEVQDVIKTISEKAAERTSGFARMYPKLVGEYFGGMYKHFHTLGTVLRPSSKIAYIIGDQSSFFATPIATAQIAAKLAEECNSGLKLLDMEPVKEMRGTRGDVNWTNKEWLLLLEKK